MLRAILRNLRVIVLSSSVALGLALPASSSTCTVNDLTGLGFRASVSTTNFGDPAYCGGAGYSLIDIKVNGGGCATAVYGTFFECIDSTDPVWFVYCGLFNVFAPVNGATWGVIGAGLCSYLTYNVV